MTQKIYTAAEVAAMFGANQRTVRRWINTGKLEASNLGGALGYRITAKAIDEFMERQKLAGAVRKQIERKPAGKPAQSQEK